MQIPSAEDLAEALNRRGGWKRKAPRKRQGFMAICPNHNDKNPSLSVRETDGGRILLHCFSTVCTDRKQVYRAVEDAMGYEEGFLGGPSENSPVRHAAPVKTREEPTTAILPIPADAPAFSIASRRFRAKSHGLPVAAWCYRNAAGHPMAWVARYETRSETGKTDKMIWPWIFGTRLRDGKLKRGWWVHQLPDPRPLYNLDLIVSNPDAIVQIHEGEKAADAASELIPGWIATTTLGGSNAGHLADLEPLRGRIVAICPDCDAAGVEYAAHMHALLTGIAKEIRILRLPTQRLDAEGNISAWIPPEGADAADWKAAGWTTEEIRNMSRVTGNPLAWPIA